MWGFFLAMCVFTAGVTVCEAKPLVVGLAPYPMPEAIDRIIIFRAVGTSATPVGYHRLTPRDEGFTDTNVRFPKTYCYVARAYTPDGTASPASAKVCAKPNK